MHDLPPHPFGRRSARSRVGATWIGCLVLGLLAADGAALGAPELGAPALPMLEREDAPQGSASDAPPWLGRCIQSDAGSELLADDEPDGGATPFFAAPEQRSTMRSLPGAGCAGGSFRPLSCCASRAPPLA